jgi:hypothetical protein
MGRIPEYLLSIHFGDRDTARMNELSALANPKDAALCGVPANNQRY